MLGEKPHYPADWQLLNLACGTRKCCEPRGKNTFMNSRIEDPNLKTIGQPTIGEQAREAAEDIHSQTESLKNKSAEAAQRMGAALNTARAKVQETTRASARATDKAIRDYPYPSLGVAFGIGILMGVLIARR
jgi:ElaB/YqjD/DUF883 family membrane-anchored ribosome-binding protein